MILPAAFRDQQDTAMSTMYSESIRQRKQEEESGVCLGPERPLDGSSKECGSDVRTKRTKLEETRHPVQKLSSRDNST